MNGRAGELVHEKCGSDDRFLRMESFSCAVAAPAYDVAAAGCVKTSIDLCIISHENTQTFLSSVTN